jgi:hypothetical protein
MNIIVTKHFAKDVDKELNEQQKQQLVQILFPLHKRDSIRNPRLQKLKCLAHKNGKLSNSIFVRR